MVLMSLGSNGGSQLKLALTELASKKEAVRSVPVQAEMAFARLTPMLQEAQRVQQAAKDAFKAAGQDRIRVTLHGGEALRLRFDVSAYFIKFAAALAGANR